MSTNPSNSLDSFTEKDRGRRRFLRVGLTGAATLAARGTTVLIGLVTLPLTSHYLGKERFGLWLTLSSFITWVSIADLGLSNSLINALSMADGKEDKSQAQQAVASAFWMTLAVAAVLILTAVLAVPLVHWPQVFNVTSPEAASEIAPALLVICLFCALRLPSSIVNCIYQGYQEGYVYQLWNGLSGMLGAVGLIAAIKLQAGLPWLTVAFLGSMLLADLLSAIYLFGWRREWLLPRWQFFNWQQAKWLLRQGSQFWVAQMSAVMMLQTSLLIVSLVFGAGESAGFGTTLRLFGLIGAVQTAFVAPLWAAYGEAAARRDYGWLSQTFTRSVKISLLWSLPAALTMFAAAPLLFKFLVTSDVTADWHLRLAVMATEILNSVARCISTLLNGLGAVRSQALIGPIGGIANLALAWLLAKKVGIPGVAWATALCLLLFWIAAMGSEALARLRTMNEGVHTNAA
jgi:O-antigen/teichoic acid export membrane protein